MTMPIDDLMIDPGADTYYEPEFQVVLETHLTFLRSDKSTIEIPVDQHLAYRYHFDLFGLLRALNVKPHLHWITMRMNNYTSPTQFQPDGVKTFLVPDDTVVTRIKQSFLPTKRLT